MSGRSFEIPPIMLHLESCHGNGYTFLPLDNSHFQAAVKGAHKMGEEIPVSKSIYSRHPQPIGVLIVASSFEVFQTRHSRYISLFFVCRIFNWDEMKGFQQSQITPFCTPPLVALLFSSGSRSCVAAELRFVPERTYLFILATTAVVGGTRFFSRFASCPVV